MAQRSRDSYVVSSTAPESLTFLFQRIADRIDALEGIRPELDRATDVAEDDDLYLLQDGERKLLAASLLMTSTVYTELAVRNIPRIESDGETITTDGIGCCYSTTGNMTVPADVFEEGDPVSFYNRSDGDLTLVAGSGLTLRLAGTASTGDRTLAQRALVTIWFESPTEAVAIGAGLT